MKLNLPPVELKIIDKEGKKNVFDRLRKQYVKLTPEEEVRQSFVSFLIDYKGYPEGLLANEVSITLGKVKKRCDTVLYNKLLSPILIIEFKAPSVEISQDTFDQIARYTSCLQAPWLIISNGKQHFCCYKEEEGYIFLKDVPEYEQLMDRINRP